MLQRWVDHNGIEHRVIDDYNRNVMLCDLTAQPQEIRKIIDEIVTNTESKQVSQVGVKFMKFCAKWDLQRVLEQSNKYADLLNSNYKKAQ